MKKFIAKLLELPTQEDINNLKTDVWMVKSQSESVEKELKEIRSDFRALREDMKTLYSGLESDIKNVKMNVKQIKPILKVEDEEAVKFIKDILSRHDRNMQTNQTTLHQKIHSLNELETSIKNRNNSVQEMYTKLNNLFNGLGLTTETKEEFNFLREIIKQKMKASSDKNEELSSK